MTRNLRNPPAGTGRSSLLDRYSSGMSRLLDRRAADLSQIRELKLERLDALMRRIVESNFDGIMTVHPDGRLGMANKAAADMFGFSVHRLLSTSIDEVLPGFRTFTDPRSDDYCIGFGHRETLGVRADGRGFPVDLCLSETLFGSDRLLIAIVRDITATKEHRRQLEHQALHDALTGLPNRVLLSDRLDHALHAARRSGEPLALLLLDLDNFKDINDTLGHHIGDMLLIELAKRLIKPLRGSDTVARLGGDEFAVLLPAPCDVDRALEIANRLRETILHPITVLDGLNLEVGVSIGVSLYPSHAQEPNKLMQCADMAMYSAKASSQKVIVYDEEKDTSNVRHLTLTGELRHAIEANGLTLAYQPILNLESDAVCGAEALARWTHPKLGVISPVEFITHAERTGMIPALTQNVFENALKQTEIWLHEGHDLSISVNLSPRILHDPQLPAVLGAILDSVDVSPEKVLLEITETAIFIDPENATLNVRRLRDLGVNVGIDDFGTGYSSLSYLQRLPLTILKIDRSFVSQLASNKADVVIVRSTIDLAHNLGLQVVAEGVETEAQLDILRSLRCDYAQGFLISQGLPAHEFDRWLEARGK